MLKEQIARGKALQSESAQQRREATEQAELCQTGERIADQTSRLRSSRTGCGWCPRSWMKTSSPSCRVFVLKNRAVPVFEVFVVEILSEWCSTGALPSCDNSLSEGCPPARLL